DVLDYTGNSKKFGKDVGNDFREGKITLPVIYAYGAAEAGQKQFWQRTLGERDQNDGDFAMARDYLAASGAIDHSLRLAEQYAGKAAEELFDLPPSHIKDALIALTHYCVYRTA